MRFCVVALNPAIDAEWCVDDVLWEEKNVVHSQRRWPGGKGANVARWLKFLGANSELLIPLGGAAGREMANGLREQRLRARIIPLRQETRVNVVVTTSRGRQMRFNPPGPGLSHREWQSILRAAEAMVRSGRTLILSGALPPGLPTDAYAQLIRLARQHAQRTILDCDGTALVTGAKAEPFLIKPNLHELSRWAGSKLNSERSIIMAARKLSAQTGGWIMVSIGADGGLLVNAPEQFIMRAAAPRVRVKNTVGAGDAMLAAVAHAIAQNLPPIDWLARAVSAGTAATQCCAGEFPARGLLLQFGSHIVAHRLR